jgi:hypothetical protein
MTFLRRSPRSGDGSRPTSPPRSLLGTTTLVLTLVSALGWVPTMGNLATIGDREFGPIAGTLFSVFLLGWLLAAVTGVVAWVAGSRRGHAGDVRAGQLALSYVAVAFLGYLVVVYHNGTN